MRFKLSCNLHIIDKCFLDKNEFYHLCMAPYLSVCWKVKELWSQYGRCKEPQEYKATDHLIAYLCVI